MRIAKMNMTDPSSPDHSPGSQKEDRKDQNLCRATMQKAHDLGVVTVEAFGGGCCRIGRGSIETLKGMYSTGAATGCHRVLEIPLVP